MNILDSKVTMGILMAALIAFFNYKIKSHVDTRSELPQSQFLNPTMQPTIKSKTIIASKQTKYSKNVQQEPIKSEYENFNTTTDLVPSLIHDEQAHEDHPILATTNAYRNHKAPDAIERDLGDTVQFDDDGYEITLAYASDIGLELDFYDLSEEEQNENIFDDEKTETASDRSLTDDSVANSNNSNKALMDLIDATQFSTFHEDRVQGMKKLSLLLSRQSHGDDLIIPALNNLMADSDRTISAAAFDALDRYIISQEKHNSQKLSTKDNHENENQQVEDDLSLENEDDSVDMSGGDSVRVEAIN